MTTVSRLTPNAHLTASVLVALLPAALLGQNAAATYLDRYNEVSKLVPLPGQVADVNHLVLARDVGRFTFDRGKLYLLSPVGGRTVGAVFRGEGRFIFAPTVPAEQEIGRAHV